MTEIFVEPEPGTSPDSTIRVPRGPLIGAAVLVAAVFAVAITARATGVGASREVTSVPAVQRTVRLAVAPDGRMVVTDAASGDVTARLDMEGNGFLFGMLRAVQHKRRVAGADTLGPLVISRGVDGALTVDDPATGMHVAVGSFGHTQVASVSRLLE